MPLATVHPTGKAECRIGCPKTAQKRVEASIGFSKSSDTSWFYKANTEKMKVIIRSDPFE